MSSVLKVKVGPEWSLKILIWFEFQVRVRAGLPRNDNNIVKIERDRNEHNRFVEQNTSQMRCIRKYLETCHYKAALSCYSVASSYQDGKLSS